MQPEFLHRAIPHFFKGNGEPQEAMAVVEARLGYHNQHESLLTEAGELVCLRKAQQRISSHFGLLTCVSVL